MTAGYSGTPLAKKLSLKPGLHAWFHAVPASVREVIGAAGVVEQDKPDGADAVHVFTTERAELEQLLGTLRHAIALTGFVWVSWPKKASKVPTDITENVIREVALPMGWVDLKVCAIDDVWSGLKLMIRKELR